MNKANCDKYPFDYNKHIIVKNMITPQYRWFTEFFELFQGIEVKRCENCMVEGVSHLSLPFKFTDMATEELHCTLLRMGLKELPYAEVEIMPYMSELDDLGFYCEHCYELVEAELEHDDKLWTLIDKMDEMDDLDLSED